MAGQNVTAAAAPKRKPRDPRLDFFRGAGMFIILYAHIPSSEWTEWIPARFGFSDATEIFVFCSGVASSLAFARIFEEAGWLLGLARIAHRLWQVWWGHIGVFVVTVSALAVADHFIPGAQYLRHDLNLAHFLDDPAWLFANFLVLRYVPNYFDILPMYLAILAMIPVAMAIARVSRPALAIVCCLAWLLAGLHWLELPAEPWSDRPWFFNPFAWQLIFFTGFAFGRGWLNPPGFDWRLAGLALAVVVLSAPFSCQYGFACYGVWGAAPWFGQAHTSMFVLIDKTHLGLFRYLHFLAIAYLAYVAAGEGGYRLRGWFGDLMQQVGRQTLAVFLSGLVLAQVLGVMLDVFGYTFWPQTIVNIGGSLALFSVAVVVEWFKGSPWVRRGAPTPKPLRIIADESAETASRAGASGG